MKVKYLDSGESVCTIENALSVIPIDSGDRAVIEHKLSNGRIHTTVIYSSKLLSVTIAEEK